MTQESRVVLGKISFIYLLTDSFVKIFLEYIMLLICLVRSRNKQVNTKYAFLKDFINQWEDNMERKGKTM